ncbi:MAG: HAMP domain-containing histidine kinase [Lachnospiraceae bacterium]|nr:HAMP domain-containing histidine kinase [Lachnospiraceae bacterium]
MKHKALGFTLVFLMITVFCGVWGISVIRAAYVNEIRTVQNIAGRVITAYPETERVFAQALADMDRSSADSGADILSHYGYDEEERIEENISYIRVVKNLTLVLAFFLTATLTSIFIILYNADKYRKKQEEEVISVLDECLCGDYAYINDLDRMRRFKNPLFADTLVKIGRSLKLKSERLNEERDNTKTLVTDISHQLKTPISALKACFTLYTEAETPTDKEEFHVRCKLQMNKIETLIAALIQISRLETRMITLSIEKVFLTEILAGAINTVYHKAQKKQISIETADFENLSLNLDKKWTIEAIANVLDNAIKYSPEGSQIMLSVQKLYNYVRVFVEDNGIGIPKSEQAKIFKRFYRGNNETVRYEDGSGVGLYLTRKILEDEGGTIFVRPAGECGSEFCINLPCQ